MKNFILLLVAIGLVYAGVNYVDWGAVAEKGESILGSGGDSYPVERTITSSDGRKMKAVIVGKQGKTIFLQRASDRKFFKLSSSRLSPEDVKYVGKLRDGGSRRAPLEGRSPKWHPTFAKAAASAKALDMPIFMLFDGSGW